jgi:putative ABC transport system permease protein
VGWCSQSFEGSAIQVSTNKSRPPRIAEWIFSQFCSDSEKSTIAGDIDEYYYAIREEEGPWKARTWYWKQVFFSVFALIQRFVFWRIIMLKNYFKIGLRSIKRNKGYSFINIFGLAVGMASCILVFLWIQDELSYDLFHNKADRLFRVDQVYTSPGGEANYIRLTPPALLDSLRENFPGLKNGTRYLYREWKLKTGDTTLNEIGAVVDASFLDMFTFTLVNGDPKQALSGPDSILLTENTAKKFFGDANPIGKLLAIQDKYDFVVSGILKDIPHNSNFSFDFLVPYSFVQKVSTSFVDNWEDSFLHTYVELQNRSSMDAVSRNARDLIKEHVPGSTATLTLLPLSRIHLHDPDPYKLAGSGNATYVYLFSVMALFLLFIACINFMNLSTAQSGIRAREVGVRKVMGAKRLDIIKQFYGESLFLAVLAVFCALVIAMLFLPEFNRLTGKHFSLDVVNNSLFWGILCGIATLTGIFSGSYPSFFLSKYQPGAILKGLFKRGKKSLKVRRTLVIFQFTMSVTAVISTLAIYGQLRYMQKKDLGFDKNDVLYFRMQGALSQKYLALKEELMRIPGVVHVTATDSPPGRRESYTNNISWEGKTPDERAEMEVIAVDHDYLKTFNIAMAQGRFFSKDFATDEEEGIVVNETAIKAMGMESPLGKSFSYHSEGIEGQIIGVLKNFNSRSLHFAIGPLFMVLYPDWYDTVCIKIRPENISTTVASIKNVIDKIVPDYPFDYQFLDKDLKSLYKSEERTGTLLRYVMGLPLFLSCLGLLGLASYSAERRTKEIGIRKVLGSSVFQIIILLSKDFVRWVLLANLLAWPIAYLIMQRWMERFAYKTGLSFVIFILAGLFTLLTALITTTYHAAKSAYTHPVKALRYE